MTALIRGWSAVQVCGGVTDALRHSRLILLTLGLLIFWTTWLADDVV